jgi:uncharacterized protein (TIGR02246 family)
VISLRTLLIGVIASVALSSVIGRAESADVHASTVDEASLRALYEQLLDGWNRGSGSAFASVFDEHADLVGPGGFHLRGRQRIASFHQMLFDGAFKGRYLVGVIRSVRFLTDDVAIVHAVGGPLRTKDQSGTPGRQSVQTMVAVRRNGKWLLDAFQNTPI